MRSPIASGVALVGAGAVAFAPMQPVASPLSNVHLPAAFSSVQLTATFDPVTPWVDLVTAAVSNVSTIGQDWLADPAPALRQLGTNWFGYAQTTATALGGVASATYDYLTTTVPQSLTTAFQQIADGNLSGAAGTINNALGTAILTIGLPLFPVLDIPGKMADNFAAVVKTVTGLATVLPALIGVLGPIEGSIQSLGDSGQAVLDALAAGQTVAALNAAFNTLPKFIGAVVNGYESTDGSQYPGLLSPPDENGNNAGIAYTLLVSIPKAIATALGAPAAPAGAALKPAAASAKAVAAEQPAAVESAAGESSESSEAADASATDTASDSGTSPTVKDGNKVTPGKSGVTSARG
ncbi:MAG: hypothetical protein HY239_03945, partial [Mycolicibacterium aromaticivorans]|nr:hypothetical protein [Mycolicibacterium aromaticivorans]